MPQEIRLWHVQPGDELQEIYPTSLDSEKRLEMWLEEDIGILGLDLLVIGRQVTTEFGGAIDLLCMDPEGDLVLVELKRDKTPREVTSQIIEYAGWVQDLGSQRIMDLAGQYFAEDVSLEDEFLDEFDTDLPEVLNEQHRMLIVASKLDPRSERIIGYLSDQYGVHINAVTFQAFRTEGDVELLGRVFYLEPEEVDYRERTRRSSKRRRRPTRGELEARAEEAGKRDLFDGVQESLSEVFPTRTPRRQFLTLRRAWDRADAGRSSFVNLIPDEPSEEPGIGFMLYTGRVSDVYGVVEAQILEVLPDNVEEWQYMETESEEDQWRWAGHRGVFRNVEEADRLVQLLVGSADEGT